MGIPILKARNLSKRYGRVRVLENITFDVNRGEILGLIGSSGSGKTTLLRTLIGFLPPTRGQVFIDISKNGKKGFESVYENNQSIKHFYGFASQQPSFYENLKVYENLEYFGNLYGIRGSKLKKNIDTLLKLMDLKKAKNLLAGNLSGGMERRLDIACSMIHGPEILFLDEPTADLDPLLREHIWSMVKRINAQGTTIVLCSHHLHELEQFCTRIAILGKGVIAALGTPTSLKFDSIKQEEVMLECYPGKYKSLVKILDKKLYTDYKIFSTKIIFSTRKPADLLRSILRAVKENKESIVNLSINKPSLDDLFIEMKKQKK